ncbi:thiol reductant ABC exporter subunit CydD [Pseudoalteromonas sp. YIC-656]|uniref:thiol reductant ABC exporter subunit CydD n=1 Tax=Pseudoalteromonas pernae TaxID=3118054 RepID=UPI003241CB23
MNPQPNRARQLELRAFLKEFTRSRNRSLTLSIICGFINALLMIASCYLLAQICHEVMFTGANLASQAHTLWALAALFIGRALLSYASRYLGERSAQRIKHEMRAALWQALAQQQSGQQHRAPAELALTLNQGVESLHDYFAKYIPAVAYAALIPFAIIAVVFPIDWKSGLIFVVTAPLIPFFMILIGYKAQDLNEQNWKKLQRMGQFFYDRISGLAQLKLFNNAPEQIERVDTMADQFRLSTLAVLRIAFISTLALEFLATISIALVAVIIGFRLYFGTLDFATGFVVLLLAPEFYMPLRQLGQHYHAKLKGLASADSMMAILKPDMDCTPQDSSLSHLVDITDIRVQDLTFRFANSQKRVLKNIRFQCPQRGLLAIVGPSGAGKSTLMDCMMGIHPSANNSVLINQQPLTTLSVIDYQQKIAWVAQSPTLFSGSIAENIALGQPQVNRQRVREVCADVDMDSFIMSLPHGYDTPIGELGAGLSGGQIQRIAIARALYKSPHILFLDEPTSALDKHSEAVVQHCLERLSENILVVVIAHRLHTLTSATHLLVLRNGELIEQGGYDYLAQDPSTYFHGLINRQGVAHG